MKKLLLLICLATMAFSCKKSSQPDGSVSSGTITGSLAPAGAFTVIYATDNQGKQFSGAVDPTTGAFKLDNLAAGKYLLSVPANALFYPLTGLTIEVLSSKTTDTGVVRLTENNPSAPFISGYLLPAGFGTGVTATEQISGKVYNMIPNATGFFLLNLPDGDYTVSFSAKAPVEAPPDIKITMAGKSLSLGNINCKEGSSGSITGQLNPYYGATSIKATNMATTEFVLATIDYTKGIFTFPVMFPGNYKISFTVNPPYLVPAEIDAVVTTGKVTDLGMVTFAYDKDIRVLSYKINGSTNTRYNQTCIFSGDALNFSLSQITFSGGIPENTKTTTSTFILSAANITGTGKYALTGTDNSNITLTEVISSNASLTKITTKWGVSSAAPVGQVEVTAIDRTARTIRGTFSATLVADKPGVANKSVTEGSFYLSY